MASRDDAYAAYNQYLVGLGGTPNADTDQDFDNLWRQTSDYSVPGGQGLDNPLGSWEDIWSSFQPVLDNRLTNADDPGGNQQAPPLTPLAPPSTPSTPAPIAGWESDTGLGNTNTQLDSILSALEEMNSQPLSAPYPADLPQVEVPGENLSPAIDQALLDIMGGEGSDPLGLQGFLSQLLAESQGGGRNSARFNLRAEQAREDLTRGEQAALADLRTTLADRGMVGLPGSAEGMELESTVRAFEPLQRAYLAELRNATLGESEMADRQEMDALRTATGWSDQQIAQRLAGVQTAQQRQQVMSDIALQVLDQNMEWNQFLAEFGLRREQVAEEIRQGRMDAIAPLMQMFSAMIAQSRGGYV